jgi:hypothetical protein
LDDIIIFGKTFEQHLQRLEEVLKRLQQANIKIKTEIAKTSKNGNRYILSAVCVSTKYCVTWKFVVNTVGFLK